MKNSLVTVFVGGNQAVFKVGEKILKNGEPTEISVIKIREPFFRSQSVEVTLSDGEVIRYRGFDYILS